MERLKSMKDKSNEIFISALKKIPLSAWPKFVSDNFEIRTPSNLKQKETENTRGGANINIILKLLDKTKKVEGSIAECGVYRGATIVPTGIFAENHNKLVYGFDSFEGFDEDIEFDLELGGPENEEKRIGGFNQTSYDLVVNKLNTFRLEKTVTLVKGFFKDTLASSENRKYSFVHLDCDIYESYKTCLEYFWERLNPGGVILFDEYLDPPWPGCKKAIDEFCQQKNIHIEKIIDNNYVKFYVEKKA